MKVGETYRSPVPYSDERPAALVICCSDGRWHLQIEDFLEQRVPGGLRADLYAIPGGPAAFNAMTSSLMEASSLESSFKFLAEHHKFRTVWLIAHEGCAFYATRRASYTPAERRLSQLDDLRQAAERVRAWYRDMEVVRVYAAREEAQVRFEILED